jgi:D-glycero-D-manno-heptose 1,7-bisphosphate phosphatase
MDRARCVLLDRDGTIIQERVYLTDPGQIEFIPGAVQGLRRLSELGLRLVVVTNQSAVGRGYLDRAGLDNVHQQLHLLLQAEGVRLDGIYFCPHTPDDDCSCRKPRPGLIERASKELFFDPKASFVIGDKVCDIEMGRNIGATTLLVRTGYGAQVAIDGTVSPEYIVNDLWDATRVIERLLAREEA